jgi:oxygen-independent coproporphyrinogen-3 oxidase
MLSQEGINRLSLGIQSFNDDILKWMNRAHHSDQAIQSLNYIKDSDFKNYSVDLIYGIPIGSHAQWKKDLLQLISYKPPHISSYCLTIEPSTVFGKRQKQGKLAESPEDYVADQFNELVQVLTQNRYNHYEISNFALAGKESRHNSAYWQHKKYLGIGPGAHSYNGHSRQYNISNNPKYIKAIKSGALSFEKEELSRTDQINEYLMTSLRTSVGCNLLWLQQNYNYDLMAYHKTAIDLWKSQEICIQSGDHLILTQKGKLLADKLTADLFTID